MKVLVTGGTGYLGRNLCARLSELGYRPVVLLHSPDSLHKVPASWQQKVDVVVWGEQDLDPLFEQEGFGAVLHLATCYGRRGEAPATLLEANCLYPLRILERALSAGVPLFLNAGTSLPGGLNAYALSKDQFVQWSRLLQDNRSTVFLNLQLEHFYGPGDGDEKFTSWLFRQLLENAPEIGLSEGLQKRDFLFIDDLVAAVVCLLQKGRWSDGAWVDVPIGSGQSVTIRDFVELARTVAGATSRLNFGAVPVRRGEPQDLQADTHILRQLGWSPKYSLAEGIALALGQGRSK